MSGILGLYQWNGQPIDKAVLDRMVGQLAHRGPHGRAMWIKGSVGLAHLMLHTTPESLLDSQPCTDQSGLLRLTWDGRLDNREELKDDFIAKGMTLRAGTDAELVLAAYECWEEEAPLHLLGDFAFAIWDGRRKRLFCARDQIGIKPFYYYRGEGFFLFGSELRPLLAHPRVRREPNEGMLGEYLASQITSQEETLFRDIFRLPPAHTLTVVPGQCRMRRFWRAIPAASVPQTDDRDYAAHFLNLFKEAVRCRMRSHGSVGSYLSGGLDSSSVVGIACSIGHPISGDDRRLDAFSLLFPGLPCDEEAYIREVAALWNVSSHEHRMDSTTRFDYAGCAREELDFPGYPNGVMGNPLRALAQGRGVRVLLSGTGGDEWFTESVYHAADLIRGRKFASLINRLLSGSGQQGVSQPIAAILRYGCWPLLPLTLRQGIKRVLGRDIVPVWLDRRFAERIDLRTRLMSEQGHRPGFSQAQADLCGTLDSGWWMHSLEIEERAAARFQLEERHPLCDRRIVEFALSLPEEQRWRKGQSKYILRQAMQGLLPESVRQRPDKAEFTVVLAWALQSLGGQHFFDSLLTASLGWVDGATVRAMYQEFADGFVRNQAAPLPHLWPLWMIAGIELWMQNLTSDKKSIAWELPDSTMVSVPSVKNHCERSLEHG